MKEKEYHAQLSDVPRDITAFDARPLRIIQTPELLGDETEVGLMHDGALYRLKTTRSGKLILTK